jgi:hypothetical protein
MHCVFRAVVSKQRSGLDELSFTTEALNNVTGIPLINISKKYT